MNAEWLHWYYLIFLLPGAFAMLMLLLSGLGGLAARFMPEEQSFAIPREGLLGLTGKVVFRVSEESGRVHVFDQYRTLHVTPARIPPGADPIDKGTDVIIASMDPDRRFVVV